MDLANRNLPGVLIDKDGSAISSPEAWYARADELRTLIENEEYGKLPERDIVCTYKQTDYNDHTFHAGRSTIRTIEVTSSCGGDEHKWHFHLALPKSDKPVPVLLHIEFSPHYAVHTVPVEIICSRGYGYGMISYEEVTADNEDFTDGIARLFYPDGQRNEHDGGKIAMWAWSMKRAMDYIETLPEVDKEKVAAVGHSRLGKTALWCAATDKRFWCAAPNCSGCSGASISRGNTGEQIWQIMEKFPFWFAKAYQKYNHNVEALPFDQHQVIALVAPRHVYVISGSKDSWADPASEYLGSVAASPVWELLGKKGVELREEAEIGEDCELNAGDIGYQRHEGTHFIGLPDWTRIMNFLDEKRSF